MLTVFLISFCTIHLLDLTSLPGNIATTRAAHAEEKAKEQEEAEKSANKDYLAKVCTTLETAKDDGSILVREKDGYRAYNYSELTGSEHENAIIISTNYENSSLPEVDENGRDLLIVSENVENITFRQIGEVYYSINSKVEVYPYPSVGSVESETHVYMKPYNFLVPGKDTFTINGEDPTSYTEKNTVLVQHIDAQYSRYAIHDIYYYKFSEPTTVTISYQLKDGTTTDYIFDTNRRVYNMEGNESFSGNSAPIEDGLSKVDTSSLEPGTYSMTAEFYERNRLVEHTLLFIKTV